MLEVRYRLDNLFGPVGVARQILAPRAPAQDQNRLEAELHPAEDVRVHRVADGDKSGQSRRMTCSKKAPDRPAVLAPAHGKRVHCRPDRVSRAGLSWTAKGVHRVTFVLWSQKRTLAPRESLRVVWEYSAASRR